jgi:HPt (histidine-containing phosphotransfer) domain-containing protein
MTIDRKTLERYRDIMGDEYIEFVIDIIQTFLDSSPKTITELHKAFQENDVKAFERAAHSIKSNAKVFGADRFAEIALDLEKLGKSGYIDKAQKRIEELLNEYAQVVKELNDFKGKIQ